MASNQGDDRQIPLYRRPSALPLGVEALDPELLSIWQDVFPNTDAPSAVGAPHLTPLGDITRRLAPAMSSIPSAERPPLSLSPPHFVFLSHPDLGGADFYASSLDAWAPRRESGPLERLSRRVDSMPSGDIAAARPDEAPAEEGSESASLSDLLAGDVRRYLNLLEDPETLSALDPHGSSGIPNLLEELLQARAALYMLRRRMRGLNEQREELVLQGHGLLHQAISTSLSHLGNPNGEWNMSQPCPLATYRAEVFRIQGLLSRRRSKDGIEIIVTPDGDVLPDAPFAPAGVPACRCGTCDAIYGADPLVRRDNATQRNQETDVKIDR